MRRPRRLAVLVLSVALIAPWGVSAAGPKTEPGREAASQALAGILDWLTRLWAENGCLIDPGGCTDGGDEPAAGTQGDNGCLIDPSGCDNASGAAGEIDAGCRLDPDGCAGAADSGDNGCKIDPSGGACRDRS